MRALTMPLGIVECEADVRSGREIAPMRQLRAVMPLHEVHSDPLKQMVAMFAAEVTAAVTAAGGPDDPLFDFLLGSVQALDVADARGTANFPLCFLYRLGEMLGVEPDTETYRPGCIFDMRDGVWRSSAPLHGQSLTPERSEAVYMLSRMNYTNMQAFRYNRQQRAELTDGIIRYLTIHIGSIPPLRTLDILRSML